MSDDNNLVDVEALRRELDQQKRARKEAEQGRAAAEQRSAAAEQGRAAAEQGLAAAEQVTEQTHRAFFVERLQIYGAFASESTLTNLGVNNVGMSPPDIRLVDEVLPRLPSVNQGDMDAAYARAKVRLSPFFLPTASQGERALIHPAFFIMVEEIMQSNHLLKVWREKTVVTERKTGNPIPDGLITHKSDGTPTFVGAKVCIELKKPEHLEEARIQCRFYCQKVIRVVGVDLVESDDRDGLPSFSTLGIASDGLDIVFLRVLLNGPGRGQSYSGFRPCLCWETSPIALLRNADGVFGAPDSAPEGFKLLYRLLCRDYVFSAAAALGLPEIASLKLNTGEFLHIGERLGAGAFCDVYAIPDTNNVVKTPRVAFRGVLEQIEAEVNALKALRGVEGLPSFVRKALRSPRTQQTDVQREQLVEWPILVLSPRGLGVQRVFVQEMGILGDDKKTLQLRRQALAHDVFYFGLRVLREAHQRGLVHGDVRPSNFVVVTGDTKKSLLLIDWGMSRAFGADIRGCGSMPFADESVFTQGKTVLGATPCMDVISLCYTCMAIAHGNVYCDAPWFHPRSLNPASDRASWVRENQAKELMPPLVAKLSQAQRLRGVLAFTHELYS
jgi:hypothetical protein